MKAHFETKQVRLRLCSPVHIGAHWQQYMPFEIVHLGPFIYKVSEQKLTAALAARHLLDGFLLEMGRTEASFVLRTYLQSQGLLDRAFLEQVAALKIQAAHGYPFGGPQSTIQPCLRGGLGQAYIPGSSIKGAIRTALLNHRINGQSASEQQALQRKVEKQPLGAPITDECLRGALPLGQREANSAEPPHREILRCLKVSDAHYSGETVAAPAQVLSLRSDTSYYLKAASVLECIPTGAELQLSITLDHGLLAEFRKQRQLPFESLADLWQQVQWFGSVLLQEERAFWRNIHDAQPLHDFYGATDANLRIGRGSGLAATTILTRLSPERRLQLRDRVFVHRPTSIFPKSRRVVTDGKEPVAPLGWVRCDLID